MSTLLTPSHLSYNLRFLLLLIGCFVAGVLFNRAWYQCLDIQVGGDVANMAAVPQQLAKPRPQLIIYNRVPKCGSSSLMDIGNVLSQINDFDSITSRLYINYTLDKDEQTRFADQLLSYEKPTFFNRHFHFIPIDSKPRPVYINLLRDPIDRLVSWYYYKRTRTLHTNTMDAATMNMTYDECVMTSHPECTSEGGKSSEIGYFKIIPFFCGQNPICWVQNQKSYDLAVKNIKKYYSIIGYLGAFNKFIHLLQIKQPGYFKGAKTLYKYLKTPLHTKYSTMNKIKISPVVREKMRSFLHFEYKLYNFVVTRFNLEYSKNID